VRERRPSLGLLADAIRQVRALGAQIFMPVYYAFLADASLFHGDTSLGIDAANDGIAAAEGTQETFYLAELYRLRAVLHHAATTQGGADPRPYADLRRARTEATARGAHSLALRAALSHVHLHGDCTCGEDPLDGLRLARAGVHGGDATTDVSAADKLLHA